MQWHFLVKCALVHNKVAEATNEKLINGFARFVYAEHVQHDLILHTLHTRQHVFAFFLTFTLCICMQNWIKCRFLGIYEKNKLFAVTFFLGEAGKVLHTCVSIMLNCKSYAIFIKIYHK